MEDNDRQLDVSRRQERRVRRANRSPDEQVGMLRSLVERASLTWKLLWDRRVGWLPKLIPVLGLAYIVSPVDLLPELLVGVLGPLIALDDIGVIMLVLNLSSRLRRRTSSANTCGRCAGSALSHTRRAILTPTTQATRRSSTAARKRWTGRGSLPRKIKNAANKLRGSEGKHSKSARQGQVS